ncbi:hypothetical protein P7C70_g2153, partial [Phenoliferia sp. Uapishka_3]
MTVQDFFSTSILPPALATGPPQPLPESASSANMAHANFTSGRKPPSLEPAEATPIPRFHQLRVQYAIEGPMLRNDGLRPASLMVVLQTSPFGDRISLLEVINRLAARQVDGVLPDTSRAAYYITSSSTPVETEPLNLSVRTASIGNMRTIVPGIGDVGDDSQFFEPPLETDIFYIWIKLLESFSPHPPVDRNAQELGRESNLFAPQVTSTSAPPQTVSAQPFPHPPFQTQFLPWQGYHQAPDLHRSYSAPIPPTFWPYGPHAAYFNTSAPSAATSAPPPFALGNLPPSSQDNPPMLESGGFRFPSSNPPYPALLTQTTDSLPTFATSAPLPNADATPTPPQLALPSQSAPIPSYPPPTPSTSASNLSRDAPTSSSAAIGPATASIPSAPISQPPNPPNPSISYSLITPNGTWTRSILVPARRTESGKYLTDSPQWVMVTGTKRLKLAPEGKAGQRQKAFSRKCKGVDLCTRVSCPGITRPIITNLSAVRECLICGSPLRRVACQAEWWVQDAPEGEDQKRVWHVGHHHHRLPPALHVGTEAVEALVDLHYSRPSSTPAALRQGVLASQPLNPLSRPAAVDIHPRFSSTTFLKRTLATALGTTSGPSSSRSGDLKLFDVKELNKETKGFIAKSNPNGMLLLQTPMMRRWIGDETSLCKRISVTGMCTDGDNSYLEAKHVLQVTVCYSPILLRWLPVAYATMPGQTAEEFTVFFAWVLESMEEEQYSTDEILQQIRSVLDFSSAQAKGFDEAIIDWYVRTKQRSEPPELSTPAHQLEWRRDGKVVASTRRRGCEQHFEASARRIGKNSAVVPPHSESKFFSLAKAFQRSHTVESRAARLAELLAEFPRAEGWSRWWTSGTASEMILTSSMTMADQDQQEIPVTTNPVEALHHLLGQGTGGRGYSLAVGIRNIYTFVLMLEKMYQNALDGYPSANLSHINLRSRSGTTRPKPVAAFPPNNGKPPEKTTDLVEALRPTKSMDKLSPSKAKKYTAAPPSRGSDPPPPAAVSGWMRGANTAILDVEWNHNSCWLESSLMAHTQLWIHGSPNSKGTGQDVLTEILDVSGGRAVEDFYINGLRDFVAVVNGMANVHSQPSKYSTIAEARASLTGVRDLFRNRLADGHLGHRGNKAFSSQPWGDWYDTIWQQALGHPYSLSDVSTRLPTDPKTPMKWTLPAHIIQEHFISSVRVDVSPALHARFSRHVIQHSTLDLSEIFLSRARTTSSPPLDFQQIINALWDGWGAFTAENRPCWRSVIVHPKGQVEASDFALCKQHTCTYGKRILGLPFVLPVRIANSMNGRDISDQFSFPSTVVVKHAKKSYTWDLVVRQNKITPAGVHFTSTVRVAKKQTAVFDSYSNEPREALSGARGLTAGVYYRYRGEPSTLSTIYLSRLEAFFAFTKLQHTLPTDIRHRTGFGPGVVDRPVPVELIYWHKEGTPMKQYRRRWLDVERSALEIKKIFQELSPAESVTGVVAFEPPIVLDNSPLGTSAPSSAPPTRAATQTGIPISFSSEWVLRCAGCGEGSVHGDLRHGGRPPNLLECVGCRTWGHLECSSKTVALSQSGLYCNICSSGRRLSGRRRKELEAFATQNHALFPHININASGAIIVNVEIDQRWYIARVIDFSFLLDPHGAFHVILPPNFPGATPPTLFSSHRVVIDLFRRNSAETRSRFKIGQVEYEKPLDPKLEASYHERRLRVDPSPARVEITEDIVTALTPSTPLLIQLLDKNVANPSPQSIPALRRWGSIALGLPNVFDSPLSVIYGPIKIGEMEQLVSFVDDTTPGLIHNTWEWHCALEHCATVLYSYRRLTADGDVPMDWDSPTAVANAYRLLLQLGSGADGHAGKGIRGEPVM